MESGTPHSGWNTRNFIGAEIRLADDDLGRVDDLALLVHAADELGDVVPDVHLAEVLGHPAPALHVEDQALHLAARKLGLGRCLGGPGRRHAGIEGSPRPRRQSAGGDDVVAALELLERVLHLQVEGLLGTARRRQIEPLAQQRHVGMLGAELEGRPVGQPREGGRLAPLGLGSRRLLAAAGLQESLAQAHELDVLGMQVTQVGAGGLAGDHRLQHDAGLPQRRLHVEVLAER
jgi:hypothetical protein